MNSKNWSLPTRFLHFGLVGTVTGQLIISLIMAEPDEKGGLLGNIAFEAHEIIGLIALGIVLLHWFWSIYSHADGGLKHLFPWQGDARQQVINDIKEIFQGHLPIANKKGGLAGLIHGLGLLAVTGVAITGAVIFFSHPETGKPGLIANVFAEFHEGFASIVWTYWLGHAGVALLHHARGRDSIRRMFSFSKNYPNKKIRQELLPDHSVSQH